MSVIQPKISAAIVMAAIEKESKPLIRKIENCSIQTVEDFDMLAKQLSMLKDLSKRAQVEMRTITDPLNEALKATRDHFKPFMDLVALLEAGKKAEMAQFISRQAEKSRALEAKLEDGTIKKVSTLVRKQSELEITTSHAQLRKIWTLEITDETKIPRQYLVPDEAAIREALKAGKNVAGCVWVQRDTVAI